MSRHYHGRRGRGGDRAMQELFGMIKLLVVSRNQGIWSYAHSFLLVGLILQIVGIVCCFGNFIISFATRNINFETFVFFFAITAIGVILSYSSQYMIKLRKYTNKKE